MQFKDLFAEYYVQFRGDSQVPGVTDPEWAIGVQYGNTAIRRWANVDGEEWDELRTTAIQNSFAFTYQNTTGNPTTTSYACPVNMRRPGGWIKLTDPVTTNFIHIEVIELPNLQYQNENGPYAWFTGGEEKGWKLNLRMSGTSNNGWTIDFPYYKKPTYFNATLLPDGSGNVLEDGTTVSECPDDSYIINSMLAHRFRATRNWSAYPTAKSDAEIALKGMQVKNQTGTPGNTWNLFDGNQTGNFGDSQTGFGF